MSKYIGVLPLDRRQYKTMTAETDLLPLPDAHWIGMDTCDAPGPRHYTADQMHDYARACVSSATEALRVEVRSAVEVAQEGARLVAQAAAQRDADKARAERLAEALREWYRQATDKHGGARIQAPGHCHWKIGIWDDDNGKYAGADCAQCALWFIAAELEGPPTCAALEAVREDAWVSVTERLPPDGEVVEVYGPDVGDGPLFDFDGVEDGRWLEHDNRREHFLMVGGSAAAGPDVSCTGPAEDAPYTHWRPLRAPPSTRRAGRGGRREAERLEAISAPRPW